MTRWGRDRFESFASSARLPACFYACLQGSEDVLELGYETRYMYEEAVLVNLVSQ